MFDNTEYKKSMEEAIERFKSEMQKIRTGRAHPDMLASLKVEVYGQYMPINQVANITAGDATMLLITPFDPSTIQQISSAIRADQTLGLNPSDDGRVVRVPVPALTEERRKEIVKTASGKVEETKILLRKIRDEARKELKNADDLSEDVKKRGEKDIDSLIKDFSNKLEELFKVKEAEIMKI